MSDRIPHEILCEIEPLGGLKGLSRRMPNKKKIKQVAKHYEILSDPIRLQVILALSQGKMCVCVLKKLTSCPDTRLSYHLSALKKYNLIALEREKSFLKYFLTQEGKNINKEILHAWKTTEEPNYNY